MSNDEQLKMQLIALLINNDALSFLGTKEIISISEELREYIEDANNPSGATIDTTAF